MITLTICGLFIPKMGNNGGKESTLGLATLIGSLDGARQRCAFSLWWNCMCKLRNVRIKVPIDIHNFDTGAYVLCVTHE